MTSTENKATSPLDNVFIIYPKHLMWLMEENKMTVPEICVALGLPSLQEWYTICRKPNQPVRNTRVVQNARIYLKKPSLLRLKPLPLQAMIDRAIRLVGDEVLAKQIIEAVFHKQWSVIEQWLFDDVKGIDLSARRLINLLMELDDQEFLSTILDGAVSTRTQVKAEEIATHVTDETNERLYELSSHPGKHTISQILELIPAPGRRIKKDEYVVPDYSEEDFNSHIAAARARTGDPVEQDGLTDEMKQALVNTPWNKKASGE